MTGKFKLIAFLGCFLLVFSSCSILRNREKPGYFAGPIEDPQYQENGFLEEIYYPCSTPGPKYRRMAVYLPPDYHQSGQRYPVLYLLHGARGHEMAWIQKGNILQTVDSLWAKGEAPPFILVMPNTNQYDNNIDQEYSRIKETVEALFEVSGGVESGFMKDVVAFVDRNFKTRPDREQRAIAGLSLGGLQSLFLSANYPESFGYIGLFSPVTNPPFACGPYGKFYKNLDKKLDTLFTEFNPKLYCLAIGKSDILYASVQCLRKKLENKKYPHFYWEREGGHEWSNWRPFCTLFLQKCFK